MLSIRKLYKIGYGPSSSHTMGPSNATRYILDKYKDANYFEVTLFGSLALTGKGHLTDQIIEKEFNGINNKIIFDYKTSKNHPNTMEFKIYKDEKLIDTKEIISIGGGLISIDGEEVDEGRDVYPHKNFDEIKKYCKDNNLSLVDYIVKFEGEDIYDYIDNIYNVMNDLIESL